MDTPMNNEGFTSLVPTATCSVSGGGNELLNLESSTLDTIWEPVASSSAPVSHFSQQYGIDTFKEGDDDHLLNKGNEADESDELAARISVQVPTRAAMKELMHVILSHGLDASIRTARSSARRRSQHSA